MTAAEYREMTAQKPQSKYKAVKTTVDGITFDSKREAERYCELLILCRTGQIKGLQTQVKYELVPKQADERAVTYTVDFDYYEGEKHVAEDVKGKITQQYVIRRKLFKMNYPGIEFREIK